MMSNIDRFTLPPQLGKYKIECKNGFDRYGTSSCIIGISVGQDYHEGEKLKALIEWAKPRFSNVTIMVADTLQRYNLTFLQHIDLDTAHALSSKQGEEWIERNQKTIEGLDIIHWNDLLKHPSYQGYLESISSYYGQNKEYAHLLNTRIREFFLRQEKKKPDLYTKDRFIDFFESSRSYLIEETAINSIINHELNCMVIYPGEFSSDIIISKDGQKIEDFKFIRVSLLKNTKKVA